MSTLLTILPIIAVIILLGILASGYVKAPPDRAYIISGLHKDPKILIGRAGIKIPFLERVDKLYLGQMTVDIKTEQSVPTNDFINVSVDAVAKVRIGQSTDAIKLAAKNFLNMSPDTITGQLTDSLQGNMREIIGTLDLRTINTDRDSFSDQVMQKASRDMEKLGIEILSCNIQNVTDENGLIRDLGADNTAKIKKDASIAKAQADKEVAVAQAQADKEANDAKVAAELEIAQKQRDLAIKQAELKQETDKAAAIADAAYEIEKMEQQKSIETNTMNAEIARVERESELKAQEVKVQEQTLEATVKKQADANKYAAERDAEARLIQQQKEAEAALYKQQKEAEAVRAKGLAEAEAIKAKGEAEAAAIEAKGLAEAEAIKRKSEAFKMAVTEKLVEVLPQMAAEISKSVTAIDKVNIYSGDGQGVSGFAGTSPAIMKQVFDTMSDATGVDFTEILKANTYDAKVTKNVNVTGLEGNSEVAQAVGAAIVTQEVAPEDVVTE